MEKESKRKFSRYTVLLAGTWAGCLLLIAGGYCFFQLPQKTTLRQAKKQQGESQQVREIADMATQASVIQKARLRLADSCEQIHSYSLPQDHAADLVFEIGKIAGELGLSEFSSKNYTNRKQSTVSQSNRVDEAWLLVEFHASFDQFVQFVHALETAEPVVFVETLSIARTEGGQEKHEVKMTLSFLATTGEQSYSLAAADPQ